MSPSRRSGNARASHGVRNGGRARDAKPRTAPMARRRDEDIAPYRNGARVVRTARGRDAKPSIAPMARRRKPGGWGTPTVGCG